MSTYRDAWDTVDEIEYLEGVQKRIDDPDYIYLFGTTYEKFLKKYLRLGKSRKDWTGINKKAVYKFVKQQLKAIGENNEHS